MVEQTLPCAEKKCNSQMILIENNDKTLGYSCLENPDEHNFRYTIDEKKWEKIIIKTKRILHYNKNPCNKFPIAPSEAVMELLKQNKRAETLPINNRH